MSDILSKEDYQSLAKSLVLPNAAFINGHFVTAKSGESFKTSNPATGEVLTEIASCGVEDLDYAVFKAREAFGKGVWSKIHPTERKKIMLRWCKLIKRHRHEIALLESLDSGKPIRDCEELDLEESLHCIEWHAELIDKIYDQVAPVGNDTVSIVVREAVGVVGLVLPWNFPLLMAAWKIAPALAAGNSLIVKPAKETSMSVLKLVDLAVEAGVPAGVLNVLTGSGAVLGRAIGEHMDIDVVSFTGSTDVGRLFLQYAASSNLKNVVLELGGKNPCIVLEDAEGLDYIAEKVAAGAFWNMGENCSAISRLIVQSGIKDKLLKKIIEKTRDWVVGDPLEPSNTLGAMNSESHFEKVCRYLEIGLGEGAKIVVGGETSREGGGLFIQPTIMDGVTSEMALAKEEIFGPILSVITVETAEEAVEVANASEYGLAASVFTSHMKKGHRIARAIKAGTVTVNTYGEGDITTPFGGYKMSGFGGRDNSIHAHDQYTELKTIWIDLSDGEEENDLD